MKLKPFNFTILHLLIFNVMFLSCASKKEIIYLQADSLKSEINSEMYLPQLQAGDILTISVTADDIKATLPFNQLNSYQSGTMQESNPFLPTYTIDSDGFIDFPKLGKVQLAGKTRLQAIALLKEELAKYIVDPGVNINLRNFRITVLGEVARPGTFEINNDRISILEALGLAGDLTIYGKRQNVLVVREMNGLKKEFRVDLTNRNSLNSPVYFLKQNDVIYIEPNGARVQTSRYTQNTSVFISVVGLIITVISVLTR